MMWMGYQVKKRDGSPVSKLDAEADTDSNGQPVQSVEVTGPDGSAPVAPPEPVNPPSTLPAPTRHDASGKFTGDPSQDTGAGHKGKNQPPIVPMGQPAEDGDLAGVAG